jgi:hypothetical protein
MEAAPEKRFGGAAVALFYASSVPPPAAPVTVPSSESPK